MSSIVYITCAIFSLTCAIMLYRGYLHNHFKMLFWSSIGFTGFALNNILLFLDLVMIPTYDLQVIRTLPALIGMVLLIYGLITDAA